MFDGIYVQNYIISMKKLIYQKFNSDITKFFLYIGLSITLIVWVIQAVNFLDFVSEDGHGLGVYFSYTALSLPKIFSRLLPFVFFLSLFYIIAKYEEENELVIFWLIGIKKTKFWNNIIKYSLIFLIIQILLTTIIVPFTQDKARSFIRSSNIDYFPSLIKEKKFIDTVSGLTIFIDKKNENGDFFNIFLKDQFTQYKSKIIYAKKGKIISGGGKNVFVLFDGRIINSENETINSFSFKKTEFDLSSYSTKSTTFPKIQELNTYFLFKCLNHLIFNIEKRLNLPNCSQNSIGSLEEEFYKRIYQPLFIPLIGLIACLITLVSKNNSYFKKFKIFIFFLGVATVTLSEITVKYANINSYNGIFLTLLPLLSFLLLYVFLLKAQKEK